jgi:hypothetical protein
MHAPWRVGVAPPDVPPENPNSLKLESGRF